VLQSAAASNEGSEGSEGSKGSKGDFSDDGREEGGEGAARGDVALTTGGAEVQLERRLCEVLLGFADECFVRFPPAARLALLSESLECLLGNATPASRAAAVVELFQRAVERWDMLEAVARVAGHVREAQGEGVGPMEYARRVGDDPELLRVLWSLTGRFGPARR